MSEIGSTVQTTDWKEFLAATPNARIYHTPEWQLFLEQTFSFPSRSIFLRDESGRIAGMLPLFKIDSHITGKKLISVPFSHICGPIGSSDAKRDLLTHAKGMQEKEDRSILEIRDQVQQSDFLSTSSFSTYLCDLTNPLDELWRKCDKGSVRWAVKKAAAKGVSVETTCDLEKVRMYYEINAMTKKQLGVPCHPWSFFRNLFRCLKGFVSLYSAHYKDEMIGGGIMICYKGTALYGYGAANPAFLNYHPYHAFIWKSVQDAHANHYQWYDFGRTSKYDRGLADFKKRWGTTEQPLQYAYYPQKKMNTSENRSGAFFRIGSSLLRTMPMALYKKASDTIFWNFG